VRFRVATAITVVPIVLAVGVASASASVPSKVLAGWKKADGAFAVADGKWSTVLEQANPSLSQVEKADAAFIPAIKTFNSALGKIGFSGKTETDINSVVKVQDEEITVLSHVTSLHSFEAGMGPITQKLLALQESLSKDLGIPAAEIIV
jgi:hypothetical protein